MTLAKTKEAVKYQTDVALIVKSARPSGWTPGRRVRMRYSFWFETANRDASNAIKILEDAVAMAIGANDKTFLPCVVLKEVDRANPRVVLEIENDEPR